MSRLTVTVRYPDAHQCEFHVFADKVDAVLRGANKEGGEVISIEPFTQSKLDNILNSMGIA